MKAFRTKDAQVHENGRIVSCPNCENVWGMEEQMHQHCNHCGYPVVNEIKQHLNNTAAEFDDFPLNDDYFN
jgi:predicted Zn finger-like uncharacterized protein